MADSTRRVSVRLSLDDAARVKAGLREVGETGQRSLERIQDGADKASRALSLMDVATRGIQVAGDAVAARALVQAGDALTQSLSRPQNATGSVERAGQVCEALYRNALQTGVAVGESVDAFQRFSIAAREIGATSDQVVRLVGGLQRVAIVSGASAGEISSATLQLAQALASGVLQGDELRSILEAMPLLAEGLARELGVSIGQLRQIGSEGADQRGVQRQHARRRWVPRQPGGNPGRVPPGAAAEPAEHLMAFDDVRFPDRIALGAEGGPTFATIITTSTGGHEQRQANWAEARRRYNVATGLKGRADVEALLAFYIARRGQLRGFRFKDWSDYQLPRQLIGITDGTQATFPLVKLYSSGGSRWRGASRARSLAACAAGWPARSAASAPARRRSRSMSRPA